VNHCAGEAGVAPVHLWSYPRAFCCTGPTGAIGTRLSLRPLPMRGTKVMQGSGISCREDADAYLHRCLTCKSGVAGIARSASDDAIHISASREMDCFASLAMTKLASFTRCLRHHLLQQRLPLLDMRQALLFPGKAPVLIRTDDLEAWEGNPGGCVEPARRAEIVTVGINRHLPEASLEAFVQKVV